MATPAVRSVEALLVAQADGILAVFAKGRNSLKPRLLVQTNRRVLVDPRLQAQEADAVAPAVNGQMVKHQLAEAPTHKRRAYVHPLDLAIVDTEQLDAATTRG